MASPYTIQFGPWSPDLQNVAVQMPYQYTAVQIPCGDCLNVYYQDGATRCLPGPYSTGPAAPEALLNCFTFYDNAKPGETVFGASADKLYINQANEWVLVPFFGALVQVQLTGQALAVQQGALGTTNTGGGGSGGGNVSVNLVGQGITFSQGSIAAGGGGGQIYNGTMVGYNAHPIYGFQSSGNGSMTPSTDINGNYIANLYAYEPNGGTFAYYLDIDSETLGQNYFTKMILTPLNGQNGGNAITLYASAASFNTYGGAGNPYSEWVWTGSTVPLINNWTVVLE